MTKKTWVIFGFLMMTQLMNQHIALAAACVDSDLENIARSLAISSGSQVTSVDAPVARHRGKAIKIPGRTGKVLIKEVTVWSSGSQNGSTYEFRIESSKDCMVSCVGISGMSGCDL